MKIGITGMTGFVGSRLAVLAREQGHEVVGFSRKARPGFRLIPDEGLIDFSGLDAVINLAGESIFGRWTEAKRERIYRSRIIGTRRLVESLPLYPNVKILVNASAIGFYGDSHEHIATEDTSFGKGFLAEVCRDWEAEAAKAEAHGVRVGMVRTGLVLGRKGGALRLIKPVFSLGLGGRLGDGRQWMSGIHLDDLVGIFLWILDEDRVQGPVNGVLPEPFRNEEFTKEVASVLRRPAIIPAPALAIKIALGELSTLLLDSSRVVPTMAQQEGYSYRYPSLRAALEEALG